MNTLDIIILIYFVPALIRGVSKGFIQQAASLASLVVSVWLAFRFSSAVSAWLTPVLDVSPDVLHAIAFAVILIAVVLVMNLAARLITRVVHLVLLGWLDHLLGMVFAVGITLLILGVVIVLFDGLNARFGIVKGDLLRSSVLYNAILDLATTVFPFLRQLLTAPAAGPAATALL